MFVQVVLCYCSYIWAAQLTGGHSIWMSPSVAGSGISGSPPTFSGVYSLSTRDAKGPRDCGSGVFIAEEV
jgi:hypothetical protein